MEPIHRIQNQLFIEGGVLYRCVKLPVEGVTSVPVVPDSLVGKVVKAAHVNSGHGAWETMYKIIRARCYFPGIGSACYDHVKSCRSCAAANSAHGPAVPPTRASVPGSPWTEVTINTHGVGHRSKRPLPLCPCLRGLVHKVGRSGAISSI